MPLEAPVTSAVVRAIGLILSQKGNHYVKGFYSNSNRLPVPGRCHQGSGLRWFRCRLGAENPFPLHLLRAHWLYCMTTADPPHIDPPQLRPEISMPLIRTVLGCLMRHGLDADTFLRDLQLENAPLHDASRRIDLAVYDQVQERAMQVLNDPALGLHMGEHTSPNTLGLLGFLLLSAPTLGDAVDQWMHFHSLVSDAEPSQLHVQGDQVLFEYQFPRSTPDCNRIRAEFGLVQMAKLAGLMLGGTLAGTEVRFQHPQPDYADEYRRVFAGPIRFDCPHRSEE